MLKSGRLRWIEVGLCVLAIALEEEETVTRCDRETRKNLLR
ncbi:hypothetical protein [Oscillatoria salina]|nr:hypothetical protein [Oscillatoria salina]